ncbi:MAG: hypothetical protein FVQ85_19560 [Planctomycetes bacterium]|nr:hypothetical protein [Planctomycetota bacterium]
MSVRACRVFSDRQHTQSRLTSELWTLAGEPNHWKAAASQETDTMHNTDCELTVGCTCVGGVCV